jgi:hypothetical protein
MLRGAGRPGLVWRRFSAWRFAAGFEEQDRLPNWPDQSGPTSFTLADETRLPDFA